MALRRDELDRADARLSDVERAVQRLRLGAAREAPPAVVAPRRFRRILAADDGTATSAHVLEWAGHLASLHAASVLVETVAPPPVPVADFSVLGGYWPAMLDAFEESERAMRDLAERDARVLGARGLDARGVSVVGSPAREIARVAEEEEADLVVLGAHGGGAVSRLLIGSVAESVFGRVEASVLVARRDPPPPGVLAATDGSAEGGAAVATALAYAADARADLVVQHVLEFAGDAERAPPEGFLKGIVERMALPAPPRVRYVLDVGRPGHEIVRRAEREGADLVVVGARGLGRVRGALFGSVSHYVASASHASVLVVRAA